MDDSPFFSRTARDPFHDTEDDGTLVLADLSIASTDGSPLLSMSNLPVSGAGRSTGMGTGTGSSTQQYDLLSRGQLGDLADTRSADTLGSRPREPSVGLGASVSGSAAQTAGGLFNPPPAPVRAAKAKPRFSLFAPGASVGTGPFGAGAGLGSGSGSASASGPVSQHTDRPRAKEEKLVELDETVLEEEEHGDHGLDQDHDPEHEDGEEHELAHSIPVETAAARDERLRASLVELSTMNKVFDGFLNALEAARGHNQRLATRVGETSALLDQYVTLLGQAHHTQQLILNEKWTGVNDDVSAIEAAEAERQAAIRAREEEAARQEAERIAKEEAKAREEEAKQAAAAATRAATRGPAQGAGRFGYGVRGRGRGGVVGGRTASGVGAGAGSASGAGPARTSARVPSSSSGARPASSTSSASGVGARWASVQGSGYGPRRN